MTPSFYKDEVRKKVLPQESKEVLSNATFDEFRTLLGSMSLLVVEEPCPPYKFISKRIDDKVEFFLECNQIRVLAGHINIPNKTIHLVMDRDESDYPTYRRIYLILSDELLRVVNHVERDL